METLEKFDYIKAHDPDSMERLKRLLDRKGFLADGNVYGERFTDRQFNLVFEPLLEAAYDRARILECLEQKEMTVQQLSDGLSMDNYTVFNYMKDLLRKNHVEIAAFEERRPVFRKRY
jgi:hypothetical protein